MELSGLSKISILFIFALLFAVSIFLFPFPSFSQSPPPALSFGETWERSCSSQGCTLTLYSYEKYFYNNTLKSFEPIVESWFPCAQGFCTRDYYFTAKATTDGTITASSEAGTLSLRLTSFLGSSPSQPSLGNNRLIYTIIPNTATLEYWYLPTKIKEVIIISQLPPALPPADFNITFSFFTTGGFTLGSPVICDDSGICKALKMTVNSGTVSIEIPIAFLQNAAYPVTIDPTIELNGTQDVVSDMHVQHTTNPFCPAQGDCADYVRQDITDFQAGRQKSAISNESLRMRSIIKWNITSLPANAHLLTVNMTLKVIRRGNNGNNNISIYHMDRNESGYNTNATGDYPPTCPGPGTGSNSQGNCMLFRDMGNGTEYNQTYLQGVGENRTFNLTSSIPDIHSALASGQASFAYGIFSFGETNDTNQQNTASFASLEDPDPSDRPKLTITYIIPANESEGRTAIETGIKGSLGQTQPIQTDQKIYLVNQNSQHSQGSFDKVTRQANQTWALNYVTSGESFTQMPSLFRTMNILELTLLISQDITSQVESFVNQTKV